MDWVGGRVRRERRAVMRREKGSIADRGRRDVENHYRWWARSRMVI